MGKAEIESWISHAANGSDSPDSDSDAGTSSGGLEWRREYVLTDWPLALEVATTRLLSSSTKARIEFLTHELLVLAKHGGEPRNYHSHRDVTDPDS